MAKGFITPKDHRAERDSQCVDTESTMAWAVANRPSANFINGGRRRFLSDRSRRMYRQYAEARRRADGRYKLGRYTAPAQRASQQEGES